MKIVMNGKLKTSGLVFVVATLLACNPLDYKKQTIGEVDFNQYQELLMSAQSQSQIKKVDSFIFNVIKDSSIARYLPQVWAEDRDGIKVNLAMLIDKPCLLVITSPYAKWNTINMVREIPKALEGLNGDYRVICLLLKEAPPAGADIPENFYDVQIEQLSALYPNSYTIRPYEAEKINLYALPSRYYFEKDGRLTHLSHTSITFDDLLTEIQTYLAS